MSLKSEFLQTLEERGFINQATDLDGLDTKMAEGPITAYIGFDATADCLHVGSLVPIMMLRWLQKFGHKPLVLIGGATSRIGDPSDKDEMRKVLSETDLEKNVSGIQMIFDRFLKFGDAPADAMMLNNADWLLNLHYIDLLRDVGKHFTINRMVTFESVKRRLDREQPLTFLEFNYMILQAYDFMELNKRFNCTLEMGGSDQWGNIVNGLELTRRVSGNTVFGLTCPLVMTATGAKMGKTAQGAVWLRSDRLPEYDYWQFWRNTHDADVGKYLRLFTELPIAEIEKLEKLEGAELNEAKKTLADEATTLAHGKDCLAQIHETAAKLFEEKSGGDLSSLPTIQITQAELDGGIQLIELFCRASFAQSKGEARRLIKGRGARLNDQVIEDTEAALRAEDLNENQAKISSGKKKHALIIIT